MATSRDLEEFHYYIQCYEAIQIVCNQAVLPCAENVIKDWHATKQILLHTTNQQVILQPCLHPTHCPARITDNKRRRQPHHCPVHPPPCQNCIQWCHAIESLFWNNGYPKKDARVTWRNINPSRLFHDYVELAKAFAVSLPPGQSPTSFGDFDPASMLKVMMKFGECHLNNPANHDVINKVYQVRNNLCHKKIIDNLQVTKSTRNGYFDDIFKLVELLEKIHPQYFTTAQADDIRDKLQNIKTKVTQEMEERAAEMKQWMQQIVKDSEDELKDFIEKERKVLLDTMTDCTDAQTRRLQDTIRGQTRHQTTTLQYTYRDQTRQQTDKLTSQIDTIRGQVTDCTEGQTRRLQDTIRGQTRQQTTTLQDTYRDQTRQQTDKLTSQIDTIRGQVTDCTEGQTRRLQDTIRGQTRQQTVILQDQMENVLEKFPARIAETREDDKYLEDVKQQLSSKYTQQYSSMRFIPSMVDEQRTTDDTFVAPELKLFSINEERRNLSCDELFSLKIRNDNKKRIIVVGSPGSGKSTLIHNRIAYDWGRAVKHQQIKLLFVIDMCKVEPGSDVFEIIEDQLFRGVQREKLEKLMEDNAQSTAFLLDGFDEVSPKWEREGRGKSLSAVLDGLWLSGSHVIVSTRPEKLTDFNKRYQGYTQVDLLGFSDASILNFIQKEVGKFRSNASAKNLERAIASLSPSLSWLSKNPLTLSMLCILWKDDGQLPKGVTSLYGNVVDFMMERSYSSDSDSVKTIPNIELVLQYVGKFALQDLSGKKVTAKEVPAEYLKVSQRIGICTTHKKREKRFRQKEFLAFPLHRSFQEFCAAKYLADIADTNHDQFLSAIIAVVDNKSLLQFCCGLSLTAASTILRHVVSTTTVNVESEDACIFGVGPRVANPWKLPLLLLFEVESQMSEDSLQTISHLHALVSPLVKNIRMNYVNWPADKEMSRLIEYFMSKQDGISWLSLVKFAVINVSTKIQIGPSLAQEQTKLIESLQNLRRLNLSSSCPSFSVVSCQCKHILRNLNLANDQKRTECRPHVICSQLIISELDFLIFLSNQRVPFSATLDTVVLVGDIQSRSQTTIKSLRELTVHNSIYIGQSLEEPLSRILSQADTPIRLSLEWTKDESMGSAEKRRALKSTRRDKSEVFVRWKGRKILVSASRNDQYREAQRQSLTFNSFSSFPIASNILTNLFLSGCTMNLKALTKLFRNQCVLTEITLQNGILSGKVATKCVNETVKRCFIKNVTFCDNFGNFLQQLSGVAKYHLTDIDIHKKTVEVGMMMSSPHNVTITKCKLDNNVTVLLHGRTTKLDHLDLHGNSICSYRELALAFQYTPALRHLNLGDNSIGSDGASVLAQSFQHTPALQHLDLGWNSIGSDGASALAQSFQHTPALQHLHLHYNRIGSDGASALAQSFQHTPALQHLNLGHNSIGSDGASALAQSFQHTPALQHLNLAWNSFGSDGASALAQSLQHTPALQHLNLAWNSFGSDGASALAQSFQHTPALQHLNLAWNSFGSDGASALAQSFQHTPALQHLVLYGNSIGSDGASALAQSFQHTPALQNLVLDGNSIGSDGASALAQSFQHTPALQHLVLYGNSIGSDGASALAQSFQHTPALQDLDLGGNSIGSDGTSALAQSFQHTPALQHLNLDGNSIGSDGASALAQSFQHTPALQHLDLCGNRIGSDGASALAQSFQHTPALQHLNLGDNSIGSDGASALAQSFQHTPALQHLDLGDNRIGSDGASALAQSFQHTPALQHLDLEYNSIGPDGASALAQSLQHTPAHSNAGLKLESDIDSDSDSHVGSDVYNDSGSSTDGEAFTNVFRKRKLKHTKSYHRNRAKPGTP
ncbi:uncharacterized protein [Amphiura filiformis]|uniref:uncharacterized protein n=1 Tax=Amphiura filiformis TaxID=82378 RepID=UPI003B225A24